MKTLTILECKVCKNEPSIIQDNHNYEILCPTCGIFVGDMNLLDCAIENWNKLNEVSNGN